MIFIYILYLDFFTGIMLVILQSYNLSEIHWIIASLCAIMIGMSKTGISGISLAVVPILTAVFGGKPSVGLLLPILVFARNRSMVFLHCESVQSTLAYNGLEDYYLGIFSF